MTHFDNGWMDGLIGAPIPRDYTIGLKRAVVDYERGRHAAVMYLAEGCPREVPVTRRGKLTGSKLVPYKIARSLMPDTLRSSIDVECAFCSLRARKGSLKDRLRLYG